jgi:DNA-directed RNA polymerase specialized sigma24 family protein
MTNAAVAQLDLRSIMGAISKREPREYVDFAHVPVSQWKIHDRLENWARWCRGASGEGARIESSPMFGGFASSDARRVERLYGALTEVPIDRDDALKIAAAVGLLPDKHRRALNWSYLRPRNPTAQARELGVELAGLQQLVHAARFKLMDMAL